MKLTMEHVKQRQKRKIQKKLLQLCLGFFFVLSAYNGIEPLQSSLNSDEGLGTTTTGVIYATAVLSSLVVATPLIDVLGPKYGILALFLSHTLYCVANFHPSWWTLVPASALVGLMATVGWGSQGIYMVTLATDYAEVTNQGKDSVMTFFTGIFFIFIGLTRPLGNMVSSIVLNKVTHSHYATHDPVRNESCVYGSDVSINHSGNMLQDDIIRNQSGLSFSVCGANHCPYMESHQSMLLEPDMTLIYILMGIYLASNISGVALTATMASLPQKENTAAKRINKCQQMLALCKNPQLALLILPYLAAGMVRAMHVGSFTQSFVSCMLGTGMVGYAMMCDGFGYAILSIISGRLTKYIPRVFHIIIISSVNIALGIIWLLWQPSPESTWLLFLLALIQGGTNGVWKVQTMAITGILFTDSLAAGYSHLMVWDCLGHAFVFGLNNFLCFYSKAYIYIGVVASALVSYVVLEIYNKVKHNPPVAEKCVEEELEPMNQNEI